MISVGIIDNDKCFLNNSTGYLQRFANLKINSVFTSLQEYEKNMCSSRKIDVLFVDQNTIGLKEIETIKNKQTNCYIIVLSSVLDRTEVISAIRLGISGYMVKTGNYCELYDAIMVAFSGGCTLGPNVAMIVVNSIRNCTVNPEWNILTKREKEFAKELLNGATYKHISIKFFVSLSTVSFHLQNIYLKLDVKSKAEFFANYSIQS
jgi:DNA-binding NarL/FixJ family response regulator